MSEPDNTPPTPTALPETGALLDIIRGLVGEVNPKWKHLHFTPDTQLERDLGLDSLARMELCVRIKSSLGIRIDEDAAICAATPNDLLRALHPGTENGAVIDTRIAEADELLMGHFGEERTATPDTATGHSLRDWLYAAWTWPVFLLVGILTWLAVVLTPGARWRQKMARLGARLFFLLTFTPLKVTGTEYLDPDNPQVLVANHASYLDGFIITAALDAPIHFIVKGELHGNVAARLLLQRFGVEFVDRFNAHRGASDVNRLATKSLNGQSLVFFPEGTFTSFPGLQPFRMGAFVTAARSKVPVVPVAISGAREIVRGKDWFPHRGCLEVTVCPPVAPQGEGWQVALDLRDAARREISRYCGEPDLVEVAGNNDGNST